MPQSSYAYAVGRVRALEPRLLSRERIARMADASNAEEAMRLLQEVGYGLGGGERSTFDYELLLSQELSKTYELIDTISPDPQLTDLFRLKWDAHNLKVLLKNRLQDIEGDSLLLPYGTLPIEKLKRAVYDKDVSDLPPRFKDALQSLEKSFQGKVDPLAIGTELDKAVFDTVYDALKRRPNAFAQKYFRALSDLTNVMTLMRCRKRGYAQDEIAKMLVAPGGITHAVLLSCVDQPPEAAARILSTGPTGPAIARGLEAYLQTERLTAMEKSADDFLITLAREDRFNPQSISPVIGYLLAREQEAKVARLIMVAKLNGLNDAILKERLRELYA